MERDQRQQQAMRLDQIADALYRLTQSGQWSEAERATLTATHDQLIDLAESIAPQIGGNHVPH